LSAFARPARVTLAVVLTALILWKSHPAQVLAVAAGAAWTPIAIAVLLTLADRALMAYRWVALLCTIEHDRRPPLAALMRVFFVSTFLGTFLPASVGGDAVRSYGIAKLNVPGGDAVASVVMDRFLGVASVLIMALVGLGLARDLLQNAAVLVALAATTALCGLTLLLVFHQPTAGAAIRMTRHLPSERLRHGMARLLESIRKYADHTPALVVVLVCSVAVQVLRIVQAYFLGRGLGIDSPLAVYFALIPLILIVMLLPVTPNGLGTGQLAFAWFFGRAGVPQAEAFALSVLFIALGIVGNLPGALLYAFGGERNDSSQARGLTRI